MAWGDVLGALGAGMAGVSHAYEGEMAQRDKERLQQLHDETLQMIAQIGAKKATDVEEIRSEAKRQHDKALQVMNELTNSTKVTVAKTNEEKAEQIAKWYNDRHINETEMILLNRLTLAEYNNQAAQKRVETQQAGATERTNLQQTGANYRTGAQVKGRFDVERYKELNANQREAARNLQRGYATDLRYRYQHGPYAALLGADANKPMGPSFQDYLYQQTAQPDEPLNLGFGGGGARMPAGGGAAAPAPRFDQFDVDPMFRPSGSMPSMGAPTPAPPPQPQASPGGAPGGAAAAPDPYANIDPETLRSSLPDQLIMRPGDLASGMTGGRLNVEPATLPSRPSAPATPAKMSEADKQQKAADLGRRIKAARQAGQFKLMNDLADELDALISQK